jgi:cell division protein FtsL
VIVVVPVLLMLGSVYLHTVSAGLTGKAADLEARVARAEAEGERLEVRVAELSGASRIRSLAAEKLGMQDPRAADLEVYDRDGEDGTRDGGEEKGGKSR